MTLLITLANKSVIHQSSDYRLSWGGNVVETANGTKQLSVSAECWTARVAFTGIAFDGHGYHSIDWLREEGVSADSKDGLEAFVKKLSWRGSKELQRVKAEYRHLTVLVAAIEARRCRLFLLSNFEAPRQNWRRMPLDTLQWYEVDLSKPVVQINGTRGAMRRWDEKCLERTLRKNGNPQAIRDRIAVANQQAARQPRFEKLISEGCWVVSLFADGTEHGQNYGEIPGIPESVMPGYDLRGDLQNILRSAPGKQVVLRQTASVHGAKLVPLPPPTGVPREIRFSTQTTILDGIALGCSVEFPRLTFEGRNGVVIPRKNEQVTAVLGTMTLEIDPTTLGGMTLERQKLTNVPLVDGACPRTWDYVFDLHGAVGAYTLQLRQNSVALRTTHCTGLDALCPNEELVLVAPVGNLMLHATPKNPSVTVEVVASFLIRDFPELESL